MKRTVLRYTLIAFSIALFAKVIWHFGPQEKSNVFYIEAIDLYMQISFISNEPYWVIRFQKNNDFSNVNSLNTFVITGEFMDKKIYYRNDSLFYDNMDTYFKEMKDSITGDTWYEEDTMYRGRVLDCKYNIKHTVPIIEINNLVEPAKEVAHHFYRITQEGKVLEPYSAVIIPGGFDNFPNTVIVIYRDSIGEWQSQYLSPL